MSTLLLIIGIIIAVLIALAVGNHLDVQSGHNKYNGEPDAVLRTPDERFTSLSDFSFEPHYIEIEDQRFGSLRVHYLDEGPADGEVILMLHGQATWSYSFRKMIPLLTAAGYRVIVPDLIGFGRSDKPADWEAHSFAQHVEWLDATLKALSIKSATAFLFDWGGYFALRLLAEQPELFSRILLVTTTMPQGNSTVGTLWVQGWRRYVLKQEVFPISAMVSQMTGSDISEETITGLDAPYPDESYKAGPRRFPMMIPATSLHPAAKPNRAAWEKLASWNGPAITLVSEQLAQRGFKPEEFHQHLSGTEGQAHGIYPNTGFFIIEDIPEELADKTLQFIEANN